MPKSRSRVQFQNVSQASRAITLAQKALEWVEAVEPETVPDAAAFHLAADAMVKRLGRMADELWPED